MLNCKPSVAKACLMQYRWNKDALMSESHPSALPCPGIRVSMLHRMPSSCA